MEINQFVDVDEVKREVTDRISLWSAIRDWQLKVNDWISAPFESIDTESITIEAEKYTKIVIRCERGLPDNSSAVKYLRQKVFEFKETMPIVIALGNKNLRPYHWKQIKEDILKVDIDMEGGGFSLGTLIEIKAIKYQEEIQNVSICASQEAYLESQLKEIETIWDSLELKIKMYREGVFILTELDEIQLQLDDCLTSINNVMGNRYIHRLRDKGEKMQKALNLFADIFDQWKECQRNWLYLENIFQSEDIRAQTRNDYQEFEKVNKSISALMTNVNKNNKVKQY